MTDLSLIRNFSIIAHIDHGKSTLADRLLMRCGAVSEREFHDQMLDSMDIERERGITIKAQTVRLDYPALDGKTYVLNLMDTPGHVDFACEVSRPLADCEGSLLAAASYDLDKVGVFTPKPKDVAELGPGEVGFIIAGIKTIADCKVGDTITDDRKPATEMLAGFKPSVPVVFCGLFPADAAEFEQSRESLSKLRLNDSSFHFEPESSAALGFGFRCGFLGLLHLEIIQERLEREFNLDLITTAPSVVYRVHLTDRSTIELHNPADMPDPVKLESIE